MISILLDAGTDRSLLPTFYAVTGHLHGGAPRRGNQQRAAIFMDGSHRLGILRQRFGIELKLLPAGLLLATTITILVDSPQVNGG